MQSKRMQWSVLGLALLGAVAVTAVGAPIVSSGPFSMPDSSKPTEPLWAGTPRRRTAVRVRVTAGTAEVHTKTDATVPDPTKFGVLSAGGDCVFEGDWAWLGLSLPKDATGQFTGFPAAGETTVRDAAAGTPTDRLLGDGTTTLATAFQDVDVYVADAPRPRFCAIRPVAGDGWIRTGPTSNVLSHADAGDWTFALLAATDRVTVLSAMSGDVQYWVYDAATIDNLGGTFTGTAHGAQGDTDYAGLDGSAAVTFSVRNAGATGAIWVYHDLSAGPQAPVMVPPGMTRSISGMVRNVRWVYTAACSAELTLQTN